ncbi:hypothetical protein BJV78DRAFT_804134 [Lactifluus subvellereus]|nr:hypothetical protein BJV78DRAFT_804134 [Lactifluus subvellereus]
MAFLALRTVAPSFTPTRVPVSLLSISYFLQLCYRLFTSLGSIRNCPPSHRHTTFFIISWLNSGGALSKKKRWLAGSNRVGAIFSPNRSFLGALSQAHIRSSSITTSKRRLSPCPCPRDLFSLHSHLSIYSLSKISFVLVLAPAPRPYLDFQFVSRPIPPCRNLLASDVLVHCCALRHSQMIIAMHPFPSLGKSSAFRNRLYG